MWLPSQLLRIIIERRRLNRTLLRCATYLQTQSPPLTKQNALPFSVPHCTTHFTARRTCVLVHQYLRNKRPAVSATLSTSGKVTAIASSSADGMGIMLEDGVGTNSITLETGNLARFADGAAVVRSGGTAALATVVSPSHTSAPSSVTKGGGSGGVPLVVDYRLKSAAGGRIPTNYLRRDLAPSDEEILTSRLIDRSVRPLFDPDYCANCQVTCNLLAIDGVTDPPVLSLNATSAALALSHVPWSGPVGAVRIGMDSSSGRQLIVNPTRLELQTSPLNLVLVALANGRIMMIEMEGCYVTSTELEAALDMGLPVCQKIASAIADLVRSVHGQPGPAHGLSTEDARRTTGEPNDSEALLAVKIRQLCESDLRSVLTDAGHDKISRDRAVQNIRDRLLEQVETLSADEESGSGTGSTLAKAGALFDTLRRHIFRELIFERKLRCDGRALDELRSISCAVDLHAPLHGSSLFQRGQSQVFTTLTFDSHESAFRASPVAALMGTAAVPEKRFLLHYEFPGFAINQITNAGSKRRRELGHGALAEKSLRAIVPPDCPFTIRLTCEVLESNGSTSMGSVCGGSLALMDAGVPIPHHVAGVSVGLVTRETGNGLDSGLSNRKNPAGAAGSGFQDGDFPEYHILTDLLGIEDYAGDMDFKLAGCDQGWLAAQLDLKIPGIPVHVVREALVAARKANNKIIELMSATISEPRTEPKNNMPLVEQLVVPGYKRSRFVGLGGSNLKQLESSTGVTVSTVDDVTFSVFAPNPQAMMEAKSKIERLLSQSVAEPELEFGTIYTGKVVEILDKGIMLQLLPNMSPVFLPNSQLDVRPVRHASGLGITMGQEMAVKSFGRDPATGANRISRKILQTTGVGRISRVKPTGSDGEVELPSSPWVVNKASAKDGQ